MKKIILFLTVIAMCAGAALTVQAQEDAADVTLKTVESKTVLYTVVRGHYSQMGDVIGKLYGLAGGKGIKPVGDLRIIYLNNPHQADHLHWLYEIQIPVQEEALIHAGTLGEMTDVKRLPEMEVATITRRQIMADPTEFYAKVYDWISAQNLRPLDAPIDLIINSNQYPDFSQMQSEIMVPVK